jgi:hypothetical protein
MNTIYNEIAEEFGPSALSINHTALVMPTRIAQRITNAYPSDFSKGRFNSTLNPQAVRIAKRYMSRVMGVK